MRNEIKYEWTLEEVEDGDIVDSDFSDKLDFDIALVLDVPYYELGLVRDEGNEAGGIGARYWAYVKDGKLPEYFTQPNSEGQYVSVGIKVPAKYHNELKKYLGN